MQRRSPPKHRHDGTSPLPLGMDWSPPPRKWNGRDTVWPHDHRTGWSYCVTIPSWVILPKSRDSDPVVFYRVQVGVQSPEGITTIRGVLRRFNDFLKLFSDLKKSFPKKTIPPAPPKGLLRLKSRTLLEERRSSLEEWITKLLSDIDLSRSVSVAAFLELEAAARSSFQDVSQQSPETSLSGNGTSPLQPPSFSLTAGSSSVTSDYGSDTAYETSEFGMRDESFGIGIEDLSLDEDLTSPIEKLVKYGMSNIDEGLFMGQTILDQLEGIPRHRPHASYVSNVMERDMYLGNSLRTSSVASNDRELFPTPESGQVIIHARKLSSESVGSDGSSLRGSEISNSGIPNFSGHGSVDPLAGFELSGNAENSAELPSSGDIQIVLPIDQQHKLNRVLQNMQRRLLSVKTDMEDLMSRLNQEMAVKDYLATKVKDLEVELNVSKQKNKENLQQAIMIERDKLTQMQWDMEELRRKSLEMELKLKSVEDGQPSVILEMGTGNHEKDEAIQELEVAKRQLENLSKQYEQLEAKSKADIKFLVKEFKSLKSSHTELKQELGQLKENKSEVEKLLQEEREARNKEKIAREKLLHDCRTLCNQLQNFDLDSSLESEDDSAVHSSLEDALEALDASDNSVNLVLLQFTEYGKMTAAGDEISTEDELRTVLANIFTLNAKLRKQLTSCISRALENSTIHGVHEESPIVITNHVEKINNS